MSHLFGRSRRTAAAAVLVVAGFGLPFSALAQDGAQLYAENCAACHQPAGQGIKGAFPPLAGNPFVKGDGGAVAATVLNGRGGMPSFAADLSDQQIATVLTFVRSSWGNGAGPVGAPAVAALRANVGPAPPLQALQDH